MSRVCTVDRVKARRLLLVAVYRYMSSLDELGRAAAAVDADSPLRDALFDGRFAIAGRIRELVDNLLGAGCLLHVGVVKS